MLIFGLISIVHALHWWEYGGKREGEFRMLFLPMLACIPVQYNLFRIIYILILGVSVQNLNANKFCPVPDNNCYY